MSDIVFPQYSAADGANMVLARADVLRGQVVNSAGAYAEISRQGRVFSGGTAVTGVAPGTAIGTTAACALYNPQNSGVDLVVLEATLAYLSGTLGIGFIHWIAHDSPTQAAITGTACVGVNARIDGVNNGKGSMLTTATVPSAGKVIRPFCNLPPMLATTVLTPWLHKDVVAGSISIAPGCGVSLQGTAAAGTSPLVVFGLLWAEVPSVR